MTETTRLRAPLAALAACGLLSCAALLFPSPPARAAGQERQAPHLTVQEVLAAEPIAADFRIPYGEHPRQIGDLRVPPGEGPWPVAILIHGGCWLDFASLQYLDRAAEALTGLGVATWNIDYRPVDIEGGGWPNTFLDVARGVEKLRELAAEHHLDLGRVITWGHSAGGHLALWAAGRPRIHSESVLYSPDPLPITGVVSAAGPAELRRYHTMEPTVCGDAIDRLMGGGPREVPSHYLAGSPFQMLPLNVPQRHIVGGEDAIVSPQSVRPYDYEARSAGDDSQLIVVPDAGHFEPVVPGNPAFDQVERATLALLGGR